MPSRRKKGGYSKRKRYHKKGGGLATKAFVKKAIQKDDETKYLETASTGLSIDYNGTVTDLSVIAQGTTDGQRIGDKVKLRGIRLQMILNIGDVTQHIRIMIVQFRGNTQTAGAPTIGQVLVPTTLGTINAPIANRVWDLTQQFNVLYDKIYTLEGVSKPVVHIRRTISIKYAKRLISYYQALTTGANKIYLMMVSDSGAATHPTAQFQIRLMYDDA